MDFKAADCFALGLVMHIVLVRRHPFDDPDYSDEASPPSSYDEQRQGSRRMRNMALDPLQPFLDDDIEPCARELVQQLLDANARARPTARDCCSSAFVRRHQRVGEIVRSLKDAEADAAAAAEAAAAAAMAASEALVRLAEMAREGLGAEEQQRAEAEHYAAAAQLTAAKEAAVVKAAGVAALEHQLSMAGLAGLVIDTVEFLSGAFTKTSPLALVSNGSSGSCSVSNGASGWETKMTKARQLNDQLLRHPRMPRRWSDQVPAPRRGAWREQPINVYNEWNSKKWWGKLPAFGLLKWLRNFFGHAGTNVANGLFADRADAQQCVRAHHKSPIHRSIAHPRIIRPPAMHYSRMRGPRISYSVLCCWQATVWGFCFRCLRTGR